ncbi:hypothetical protein [Rhizobacter sp. OV335]|uniref:hypothetical protein n=1 Tax=Rhizobacter sp. OV335 TaxID=1500264 RepID=UPI001F2EC0F1|nr:hypothetical protein [Rhizobacter sp. OV335]
MDHQDAHRAILRCECRQAAICRRDKGPCHRVDGDEKASSCADGVVGDSPACSGVGRPSRTGVLDSEAAIASHPVTTTGMAFSVGTLLDSTVTVTGTVACHRPA